MEIPELENSALKVNAGIPQPEITNSSAIERFKNLKRKKGTTDEYIKGILSGNRTILSQAITLIESTLPEHQDLAQQIVEKCLPLSGRSIRIGITGVPGVGKSSFIEALGTKLVKQGHKLAVLAIDPSSERSGGSILGDKTRMEELSAHESAFIRPSPSTGTLGGVAARTRETIILCESAGYDIIIIETVGVGQSETIVHSMTDFFLLLMLAGAGDELQGIKRGIMEMADALVITKADGTNAQKAELARSEYQNALHLFPAQESGWIPKTTTCSAHNGEGIDNVWKIITEYIDHVKSNEYLTVNRNRQSKYWMYEAITDGLKNNFYNNTNRKLTLQQLEASVLEGKKSSHQAAKELLELYFKQLKNK